MSFKKLFKMPKAVKIIGRTSSITNSFVNGIIPVIEPTEEEIKEALSILGMNKDTICCSYCGDRYTEWDHLRPLVINKTATGYVSEIHNLVPACGKCNQSKGNQYWLAWMYGNAKLSPATRKIQDIDERSKRLKEYENWGTPLKVDIESIIGKYKWQQHWENCEKITSLMHESQILSNEIQTILQNALNSQNKELSKCFFSSDTTTLSKHHKSTAINSISRDAINISHNSNTTFTTDNIDATKAVGKIVQNELVTLLQSNKIDKYTIDFLQKREYSKSIFGVNYPVLLPIESENDNKKGVDNNGINRYYSKPIQIQGTFYLLTSQWYERNKDKLIQWMKKYYK